MSPQYHLPMQQPAYLSPYCSMPPVNIQQSLFQPCLQLQILLSI
uniref:Uncharacterized protein n=1 Tax=Rhizophora mucronata TaxID=61149 RepID=A0A2P2PK77_RHIMU